MIDFLRGKVVHLDTEYVVVDVRDVGYRVFTPNPYIFAKSEEPVVLYIHHHVREDAIQLFGFATREEQAMFRKLLDVSGIGPRVALGVLAGGKPEVVAAAIQSENLTFLTKLPGIGKKTAQRMVLDLKDKLGVVDDRWAAATTLQLSMDAAPATSETNEAWAGAKEALFGLGYREVELDKAWNAMKGSLSGTETTDVLMKKALQQLFQG
ncbi:Holliday junction branch migration protein RuvA [Cohnella thailandensis]|uniref:Holliday junction branch migration complex subunit RuvA n=1 Tax=Cohnella thailandensis TaxID=557557 RepID=A0A841SNB0_9BACL|nr:Holliday junction branch migration protein RuvA [Cohnella thailandensis]MBP1972626.1 Holliday junction DNA helicase RuvA [Cohnella thailandensis]